MIESPAAGRRKRSLDGISRVQKVVAMEKWFRGSPGCFYGIRVYVGERSTSVELRGAHEGGGSALLPRGFLVEFQTSTLSLLDCFRSKKDHREGFIPFGLRLVFLFYETLNQGKNRNWQWALG